MMQDSGCRIMKTETLRMLSSERGMVLVVSLLMLLVATVAGITALSTSTTNVMIAGNQRLSELNFSAADSGVYVSAPIINKTAYSKEVKLVYLTGDDPLVPDATDFIKAIDGTELCDEALTSPDISFTMGSGTAATTVSVDVDNLYPANPEGFDINYAGSYDGDNFKIIYYDVRSVSRGDVGSETAINAVYQHLKGL
jgi:Tfp pilus assembly protein PilX